MNPEESMYIKQRDSKKQIESQEKAVNKALDKNPEMTSFEGMDAEALCFASYGNKLETKKAILEYIERVKSLSKEKISSQQVREAYKFIEEQIDKLKAVVKPNTALFLKKELDDKLGKFVFEKTSQKAQHFLNFFTEAYPKNKRDKRYTWVLVDIKRISDEQILHTLKYINAWCFKNKLKSDEKTEIAEMVNKLVRKGNLKYINQVKSLEGLMKGLRAKIIEVNGTFALEFNKKKNK